MRCLAAQFPPRSSSVCFSFHLAVPRNLSTGLLWRRGIRPAETDLVAAVIATALGAIPLGSSTAFLDLTGSFIILSTVSYAIPFVANVITKRKFFPPGPFHLGKLGTPINVAAVLFITIFDIFYCFRESPPSDKSPSLSWAM